MYIKYNKQNVKTTKSIKIYEKLKIKILHTTKVHLKNKIRN